MIDLDAIRSDRTRHLIKGLESLLEQPDRPSVTWAAQITTLLSHFDNAHGYYDSYPQAHKLRNLDGANNVVGDFLTWMQQDENGPQVTLCAFDEDEGEYLPTGLSPVVAVEGFFGLDGAKLEAEKADALAGLLADIQTNDGQ